MIDHVKNQSKTVHITLKAYKIDTIHITQKCNLISVKQFIDISKTICCVHMHHTLLFPIAIGLSPSKFRNKSKKAFEAQFSVSETFLEGGHTW